MTFRTTGTLPQRRRLVALVSLTVAAAVLGYTKAHCPECERLIMTIPGRMVVNVRSVDGNAHASGRGRVVVCRCRTFCEVVEYAPSVG